MAQRSCLVTLNGIPQIRLHDVQRVVYDLETVVCSSAVCRQCITS